MTWATLVYDDEVLLLTGGTMSGAIAMGTSKITGLGDPADAQDAATKAWVEANTLVNPVTGNLDMATYSINNLGTIDAGGDTGITIKDDVLNMCAVLASSLYGEHRFYVPLYMDQNEIRAMVFENLASAPHAAIEVQGEVYYNTADDHLHVWVV